MKPALRIALLLLPVVLAGALVACGGSSSYGSSTAKATQPAASSSPVASSSNDGGGISLSIADFSFSATSLKADPGKSIDIAIKNTGAAPHTFTIDGVVDSGQINAGGNKTLTLKIDKAGAYRYYCTVHGASRMSGVLQVGTGGDAPAPAPTGSPASPSYY
ncbi:MAG TPA: cupredoxin domain-containing protein [Dehalococcoidia bacterium]|nr:cupredoxin domain-containing protein [Dehalococcoidia bacterium]